MESTRFSGWLNRRTLSIGMVGGHTKPSTGYTFMRIQNQIRSIVDRLKRDENPVHSGGSSYRFRVYDIMLLSILAEDPKMGVQIFHDLFKKNSMELIFKFLDERTHFFEELKIFSTLPYIPFLKAIYRMRFRILSGA
jgi:lycopene beta-cyclase